MTEAEIKQAREYKEKFAHLIPTPEPDTDELLQQLEKKLNKLMKILEKWGISFDD